MDLVNIWWRIASLLCGGQVLYLLDLLGLSLGFTSLILKHLKQPCPCLCISFCPFSRSPAVIVVSRMLLVCVLLWTPQWSMVGSIVSIVLTLKGDSCNALMITFLFISLPAEKPCPHFLFYVFLTTCFISESGLGHMLITTLHIWCLGHESEDSMSTLAGRRGMRPKMMMPFDSQPPQRKLKVSLSLVLPV